MKTVNVQTYTETEGKRNNENTKQLKAINKMALIHPYINKNS